MTDKKQYRNWVFTVNNYGATDIQIFEEVDCRFVCYGKEVGESGTPHLQGLIIFDKRGKTLNGLKKVHPTAHWEPMKGTVDQAYAYCIKDGDVYERGDKPMNQAEKGECGKRSLEERWDAAKKGRFEELDPENIKVYEYIYAKFADKPADRDELDNLWIVGPSGCGKSKYVRQNYEEFFTKPMSKWWDGYQREDVVLLDDFDPSHGKFLDYYLKIWADHYPFNAEVKGGMLNIRPKTVIVTSQYLIEECFESAETIEAIKRRFKVMHMVEGYKNGPVANTMNIIN